MRREAVTLTAEDQRSEAISPSCDGIGDPHTLNPNRPEALISIVRGPKARVLSV